jgi:hypothetical protein
MGFLGSLFGGGTPSQKTPEQEERNRLAEEAIGDAERRGITGGKVLEFEGEKESEHNPSYTGRQERDGKAA